MRNQFVNTKVLIVGLVVSIVVLLLIMSIGYTFGDFNTFRDTLGSPAIILPIVFLGWIPVVLVCCDYHDYLIRR